MTLAGTTRENLARAAVEGLLSALADGMDAFVEQGLAVEKILLIGGGAASAAVQQIAPEIFGQDVWIPEPGEYVANGAARQAAWLALGELPTWDVSNARKVSAGSQSEIREAYGKRRHLYVEQ